MNSTDYPVYLYCTTRLTLADGAEEGTIPQEEVRGRYLLVLDTFRQLGYY